MARVDVNEDLIKKVKTKHPELERLTPTDLVDWALRLSLREA